MSGSKTSAAHSCTRCWLPNDSLWTSSSRRLEIPRTCVQRCTACSACSGLLPVQPREVAELAPHPHARVEAAFLGHVADPAAHRQVHRPPRPPDLAGVRRQHADRDPHRRGLSGAVRSDKTKDLAGPDGKAHLAQGAGRRHTPCPGSPARARAKDPSSGPPWTHRCRPPTVVVDTQIRRRTSTGTCMRIRSCRTRSSGPRRRSPQRLRELRLRGARGGRRHRRGRACCATATGRGAAARRHGRASGPRGDRTALCQHGIAPTPTATRCR